MAALAAGRLVLHPTETVASLSGDPGNASAVDAARSLKGYPEARPFLCLVADAAAARALAAAWPDAAERLAAAFWPGPLTLVLEAAADAPGPVVAAGRIALRPAVDGVSRSLLAAWGAPLFSTSANRRGDAPAVGVREAAARFAGGDGPAVGLLEPAGGTVPGGTPSTVVDATGPAPRLLRPGAIPAQRLRRVCPDLAGGASGA